MSPRNARSDGAVRTHDAFGVLLAAVAVLAGIAYPIVVREVLGVVGSEASVVVTLLKAGAHRHRCRPCPNLPVDTCAWTRAGHLAFRAARARHARARSRGVYETAYRRMGLAVHRDGDRLRGAVDAVDDARLAMVDRSGHMDLRRRAVRRRALVSQAPLRALHACIARAATRHRRPPLDVAMNAPARRGPRADVDPHVGRRPTGDRGAVLRRGARNRRGTAVLAPCRQPVRGRPAVHAGGGGGVASRPDDPAAARPARAQRRAVATRLPGRLRLLRHSRSRAHCPRLRLVHRACGLCGVRRRSLAASRIAAGSRGCVPSYLGIHRRAVASPQVVARAHGQRGRAQSRAGSAAGRRCRHRHGRAAAHVRARDDDRVSAAVRRKIAADETGAARRHGSRDEDGKVAWSPSRVAVHDAFAAPRVRCRRPK